MIKFAFLMRRSSIFLKAQVSIYILSVRKRLKNLEASNYLEWVNGPDGILFD